MVELLSPAGDLEKLKIALAYGADAVYAGLSHFSLRVRSGKDFDDKTFQEGINYVHEKGKKLYATVNGFPFNSQIELYKNHIAKLRDMGPDAFIVATPGVIKLCKQIAPNIPIHLSTQANVLNYMDAEVYMDMGVERVIAAREIGLKDLVSIKEKLPELEIEIFVHGSMCFAYSGRCLISSLQTGRVSNKGSCANDCRFPYEVYAKSPETGVEIKLVEDEEGTHIFNAKDLNMAEHVARILETGAIDSLKIEGRTKAPYYLGTATRTYRSAIDDFYSKNFDSEKYIKELDTIKNRGFTDGYLVKRPYEKPNTQTFETSITEGTMQVVAIVNESEEFFLAKHKITTNTPYEIVLPIGAEIQENENELGKVFFHKGTVFVEFKKLVTQKNKEMTEIHSGNVNPVKLPVKLPPFTFLRSKI